MIKHVKSESDNAEMMREKFMRMALSEAKKAEILDEVPIGAVIVLNGKVIAKGHNLRETKQDSTLHAEIVAIKKACKKLKSWRLLGCVLYVTIEPCPMCAGAIVNSRMGGVVYGAEDNKAGAVKTLYNLLEDKRLNHRCEVHGGVLRDECRGIISSYFRKKREKRN